MILGKHTLTDIYDVKNNCLDNIEEIKKIILESCKESNLHVVEFTFHKFEPYGLSGICILKESHLAIHTWPEYNFASIDAFTCGTMMNPTKVCNIIAKKLQSNNVETKEFDRGNING